MKKLKKLLVLMISLLLFPLTANAASGNISVSGSSTAVVGNKVTVTVTLSSSTLIGSWQMSLDYDSNYLQLTGSTAEEGGNRMAASSSSGTKKKTYTFTFKTLKKGKTNVKVSSYLAYAFSDLSQISLSQSGKSINIITQAELEASYSKDNNLKGLKVENFEITPEFNKDVLEYSAVVPENTKEINIIASLNDRKASVSGAGTKEVTSGVNTFDIVVRAENGSTKTYKLNVEVKDANPINVEINKNNYTVVKIKENLPAINSFEESTVKINEFEIPAYYNDKIKLTLVGLKSTDGTVKLYKYKNDKYEEYVEINSGTLQITPTKITNVLDGYKRKEILIDGVKIEALVVKDNSKFALIYGINVINGKEGFYSYNIQSKNILQYDSEMINLLKDKNQDYMYVLYVAAGLVGLSLIIIIALISSNGKKNKLIKKYLEIQNNKENNSSNQIKEDKKKINKE